jgi:hypothetical protein
MTGRKSAAVRPDSSLSCPDVKRVRYECDLTAGANDGQR